MDIPAPVDQPLPRFLVATQRYEHFLIGLAEVTTEPDSAKRATFFHEILLACGGLVRAAHDFDWVCSVPDLVGTSAETSTGKQLLEELAKPSIPEEVRAIYSELYGPDLTKYN